MSEPNIIQTAHMDALLRELVNREVVIVCRFDADYGGYQIVQVTNREWLEQQSKEPR